MLYQYIATLTNDSSFFKILEMLFYRNGIELRLLTDLSEKEQIIADDKCIALMVDTMFDTQLDLNKIKEGVIKPVVILPSQIHGVEDLCILQENIESITNPLALLLNKSYPPMQNNYMRLDEDVFFSIEDHCIKNKEQTLLLTNLEFRLLYYLIKRKGTIISVEQLLDKLDLMTPSSLYVCVRKLREKIEYNSSTPSLLIYHKYKGYSLNISTINKS